MKMSRAEATEYLNSRSRRNETTGCLISILSCGSHGYAQGWDGENVVLLHRLRWWAEGRRLPRGRGKRAKKVLHTCDNRRCNEITHLFLGNDKKNNDDKIAKGRSGYGRAHSAAISEAHRRSGYARLSRDAVHAIFVAEGTHAKIGLKYGVSKDTVGQIKRRVAYRQDTADLAA